jgi:hypothetical protein
MKVTIDQKAWERGVRDGFARFRDPSAYSAMTNAAYSYWSGWIEGDAARGGYEVSVQAAKTCGLLPREGCDQSRDPRT